MNKTIKTFCLGGRDKNNRQCLQTKPVGMLKYELSTYIKRGWVVTNRAEIEALIEKGSK